MVRSVGPGAGSRDDIIRTEYTWIKEVARALYPEINGLMIEFFKDVAVKPAAGTLRIVEALVHPDMMVEHCCPVN